MDSRNRKAYPVHNVAFLALLVLGSVALGLPVAAALPALAMEADLTALAAPLALRWARVLGVNCAEALLHEHIFG